MELEGSKKKTAKYKTPPTGWKSKASQMVTALLGIFCALPDTPTLKDPRAQGITRLSAQTWRLVDSFNLVYPIAMRDHVAAQTCDYYAYQRAGRRTKDLRIPVARGRYHPRALRRVHCGGCCDGHCAVACNLRLLVNGYGPLPRPVCAHHND